MKNNSGIYISHSPEDQNFVTLLIDILEHHGIKTFKEAISKADSFIIVLNGSTDQEKLNTHYFSKVDPNSHTFCLAIRKLNSKPNIPKGTDFIDFRTCMVEGFKALLKQYGKDYSINPAHNPAQRSSELDRRMDSLESRFRWDCWDAYNSVTQKNKQQLLKLKPNEVKQIINVLSERLKKHTYLAKGHKQLNCEHDVVRVATLSVMNNMIQQTDYTAIQTINAIADTICDQFYIEAFDRRKQEEALIENIQKPSVMDQRLSSRESCDHTLLKISTKKDNSTIVKIVDQSLEGIGFISLEKLKIQNVISFIRSDLLPFNLSENYSIKRKKKIREGYFYGAQAIPI